MSNIQRSIFSTIGNHNSPVWFPALTKQLVDCGWETINEKYGIQKNNYSTSNILNGCTGESIALTKSLSHTKQDSTIELPPIEVYPIPKEIESSYSDSGAKSYSAEVLQNSTVFQCLQDSLDLLATIPTSYETVSHLIASLHILQPEDDEFDISYSLPNIPFSIFISIPSKRMENDELRVAEAILHEAMHLQLTLIEQFEPMIIETDEKYFSPWKNENRHPRGVLHAIYVFCVISQFFELHIEQDISDASRQYLKKRCKVICKELKEVIDFKNFPYFTKAGQTLINRLL